ncbi:TetR/AcrR family transcriptional regulator [Streptomyces rhizosphaerihabitans]|uniref:TetR/AcrR family transcriptional regulator n=1 Tax=Streptomyces rhizosphaerihabitans TaxID=1266770 RepID=UPI0021C252AD|nr:TetR family transcriptional regulator [Streptomyces rhizosphaerihabitans]MCT9011257.1 TetR family transcriptional regulator [Streptomyces rhizosphaerihabitans]
MNPESKGRRRAAGSPVPQAGRDTGQSAAAPRRPGSHDPEGNRRAVLDAARRLFGAHGYKGVGVRAIAAEAGVTPGLVMAYFGTKDGLFREAIGGGAGVSGDVLGADGTGDLPAALARAYLERWDRLPAEDPWPALIRSAVSHPPSAELLRTILEKQVGEPLARLLGDSAGADVRTAMIRSVLFGVIMERYVFAHEPAASVPTGELAPALTDVLTAAFGDALDPARRQVRGTEGTGEGVPARPESLEAESPEAQRPESRRSVPTPPGADDSASSLFDMLSEYARRYQGLVGRTVREYGISLPAYEVLATLRDSGEPYHRTMGEVAAAGTVRAGGLTQHADRLEAVGLIRRERDADDRRIVRLCLTPEGVALSERVFAARSAQERELLAGFGPADRRRLSGLLGALGQTLGAGVPEQ